MMFCWHRWSKWQDVATAEIHRTSDSKMMGVLTHQERRCEKCNLLHARLERASL